MLTFHILDWTVLNTWEILFQALRMAAVLYVVYLLDIINFQIGKHDYSSSRESQVRISE